MIKKILIGLGIILLLLFGAYQFIKAQIKGSTVEKMTADVDTKTLFETRCGICHNGASPEVPRMETLKKMPQERIIKALTSGVMMNQAAMLTEKQHIALAKYISEVTDTKTGGVIKGMCEETTDDEYLTAYPRVDNWGIGFHNKRYYDGDDVAINEGNVGSLKLSWTFAFPNATRARVQPTIAGNTLFTASQTGTVYALDRKTGCIQWTFQADAEIRSALVINRDTTGMATELFFGDFSANVYSVDLLTKKLNWKKNIGDSPYATITGTLSIFENRLFIPLSSIEIVNSYDEEYECCTFRGSVVSLNKDSGDRLWKTYTIDEAPSPHGKTSAGTTILAPSGAPIWTGVTVDAKRRRIYVGSGENYARPVTKTSDAIIAFDMDSGEKLWANQTLPDDAWNAGCVGLTKGANCPENNGPDADFGAPPILVERPEGDLLLAGQKSGFVYALDPDNQGKTLWTELVGRGGTMGGIHWGMATDGKTLYVPINDRGVYQINKDKPKSPGLHALDVATGKQLWATIEKDRCPPMTLRGCGPGLSAAITLVPDIVFAGTLDGFLKAYSANDGRQLWAYDTKRDYDAVNGAKAYGGAIDSDGPIVVENQLFVSSGYAKFGEVEGNVILAFEVE